MRRPSRLNGTPCSNYLRKTPAMNGNFSESARTLTPNEFAANEIPIRGFSAPQHDRDIHQATNSRFLTLKEFARLAGISESTVRRRVRDGSLPVVQLGGKNKKLLFPIDALDRVNIPTTPTEDNDSVDSLSLSSSRTQADDSAGSRPRWTQKLRRRAK